MGKNIEREIAEDRTEVRAAQNRERRERVSAARAQLVNATGQLEAARDNLTATGIDNPVFLELRQTIAVGHRMIARSTELLKRIP